MKIIFTLYGIRFQVSLYQLNERTQTMSDLTSDLRCAVENVLRSSLHPMTSTQIFRFPEVRTHTTSANRVGECLAMLWREGRLTRLRAAISTEIGGNPGWSYLLKSTSLPLVSSLKEQERYPRMSETDQNSTWGQYLAALKTKN